MESFNKLFENWYLVLYGLLFWGSIFGACLFYILETSIFVASLGYFLGLLFGLIAQRRGWGWIQ
tara:strand:- start:731 stop:922 length:192 start_codon:yes stop_codon:yes gene_type:complete